MYFTLVRSFGGVPLVDHVPVTGVEADKRWLYKKTKEEIYAFIEKDLKEAIEVLPGNLHTLEIM
jgi:hypothetical protein